MADELKARLSVDTSGFKAGMADAASSMRSVEAVSKDLNAALKSLADAELQLGKSAAEGNAQAAAIIDEYKSAVGSLRDELALTKAAQDAQTSATLESTEAVGAETVALRSNISARMAATAEISLAEGHTMGLNRAAAAYLTTLPGIGAAAQAAFAVAGPIALIAILGQLVHAIDGVIDDYRSLSDAARQASIDQAAAAAHGIVTVQPKVGISERIARFAKGLTGNADAPNAIQSSGGSDETLKTTRGVEKQNAAETELLLSQSHLNEAGLKGSALAKQKQKDIQAEIDLLYKQSNALGDVLYASQQVIRNQESTQDQVKFAQQQITAATEERETINTRIQVLGNNKQAEAKMQSADAGKDNDKAAREKLQAIETQFAEMNTKLPEEATAFWRQYVGAFKEGSTEYLHVIEQVTRYTDEFEKGLSKQSEIVKKFESEQLKLANLSPAAADKSMEQMHKWMVETAEDITRTGQRWNEYAAAQTKGAEITEQNNAALAKQRIAFEQAEGTLRPLAAAEQIAAINAEEYRKKLEALNEELARLKKEGANLVPGSPEYSKNQTQQAQLSNQILGVQGQANLSGAQNSEVIAKQMAAPYVTAANDVQSAFEKAFTEISLKQKTWRQAMAEAFVSLELDAAKSAEQWLAKWIDSEILSLAKHVLTNEQKVAADTSAGAQQVTVATTAAAAKQATTVTTNVAQVMSEAAVAGAAAFASTAAIPIVGPAIAPGAAAAAYASVASMASLAAFDVGTNYVPKTGVAMIHKGEQIVTQDNNRELMDLARSGVRGGGSVTHNNRFTLNQTNHNSTRSTASELRSGVMELARRGKLGRA